MIQSVLIFVAIVVVSFMAHEYGHALTAKALGWKLVGWKFYWYAVGYAFIPPEGKSWRLVALGGLTASAILMMVGWAFTPAYWAVLLFGLNALMLICQAFPIPRFSDGWVVIKGKR